MVKSPFPFNFLSNFSVYVFLIVVLPLQVTYPCRLPSSLSVSPILTTFLSHHHMGLTAQENENLKQGRAPHLKTAFIIHGRTRSPPFHIQRQERRRNSATCCNCHALEKFEAGGRNSLSAAEQLYISQRHCCLPHICISLKQWNINY